MESQQDIINRAEEIKKLVTDEFKPFSGKTSLFFEKLGNTIKDKMAIFASGLAVLVPTTASMLYGTAQTAENLMYNKIPNITMNNGLGDSIFNYDQTVGLVSAAGALMVAHFALPPIAKAISKIATHFELKQYFAENEAATNKFVGLMEKLGDGRSKEDLHLIAKHSKAGIMEGIQNSRLAENPSVREKINIILEEKVFEAYRTSVDKIYKKPEETSLSR
jgi:hypothetical protein